jgi:hypothetical protein
VYFESSSIYSPACTKRNAATFAQQHSWNIGRLGTIAPRDDQRGQPMYAAPFCLTSSKLTHQSRNASISSKARCAFQMYSMKSCHNRIPSVNIDMQYQALLRALDEISVSFLISETKGKLDFENSLTAWHLRVNSHIKSSFSVKYPDLFAISCQSPFPNGRRRKSSSSLPIGRQMNAR